MDAQENEEKDKMGTEEKGEHNHAVKHSFDLFGRKNPVSKLAELLGILPDFRESFEQEVFRLSDLTSKTVRRERFNDFGDTIDDDQEIHRNEEAAKASMLLKLETTPAFGALTIAYAEEYLSRLLNKINLFSGKSLVYNGMMVKFKHPLYPGENLKWRIKDSFKTDKENKGISLSLLGVNDKVKKILDIVNLSLMYKRPEPGKAKFPVCPSSEEVDMIYHRRIDSSRLDSYFRCLDESRRDEIPMALVSASAPAAILRFAKEKVGKLEGIYMSVDLEYYNSPCISDFKTFIKSEGTRKNGELYNHTFLAWCFQEEEQRKPIFSAKLACLSSTKID